MRGVAAATHDWGGAIGMQRSGADAGPGLARFVLFNTAAFPGGLPAANSRLPRAAVGPLGGPGAESLRPCGIDNGRASPRQDDPRGPRRAAGAVRFVEQRAAIHRFVMDIPLHKSHPTRAVLEEIEGGLAQFASVPSA